MVSKAREDLPEPDSPVITVKRSRGISTLMFLRLSWRAPRTVMRSIAIAFVFVSLFVGAALSDYHDGDFARRRGQLKELGQLVDPIADIHLNSAALRSLV